LDEGCLKVAKGDLIASVFLAFVFSGFFGLVYNINPESGWPILTTIGLLFFSISAYLLGILGLYTGRPWYSELAGLGRRYKRKRHKFQDKSR
jgi:hypothetical protein